MSASHLPVGFLLLSLLLAASEGAVADTKSGSHAAQFGAGAGPHVSSSGRLRLLDGEGTPEQSNAVSFDLEHEGAHEQVKLEARLRVMKGGDGGAFVFLNTAEYGRRGPGPFMASWVEPNLRQSLAVGIDVHDPKDEEMFSAWGNYQGLPQREISLHWDGREIVKRLSPEEFRGSFVDLRIQVDHVAGGAEVSVSLGKSVVYDHFFVPGLLPYENRLMVGAGTRSDASTEFDVRDIELSVGAVASPRRPPLHVELFNHVLTDNTKTAFETEADLPPALFAFGRIVLTLDIHDAGPDWDEWDRNGHFNVFDEDGNKWDILPFITSYRTACHWQVDLTHFRSLLSGKTRFEIVAGTHFYKNRGYMMSASLDFYHGELNPEPYQVVPLWHGVAKYRSAENHFRDFFQTQTVDIPSEAVAARVVTTTTGHSQIGEFVPSDRTLSFRPVLGEQKVVDTQNTLWKNDCYLNPNRPQFGTWKFSRAGWAPGDVVHPWWIDLTASLRPGETAQFQYAPKPYTFEEAGEDAPKQEDINKASHVIRSFLILYRESGETIPAPTLRISTVQGGSAADKAGMEKGDYLASYDGVTVDSVDALGAAKKAATEAGKTVATCILFRKGERLSVEIATGRMGVNIGNR